MNVEELLKLWSEKSKPNDMSQLRNDVKVVADLSTIIVEEFENAGFSREEALIILTEIIKANKQ